MIYYVLFSDSDRPYMRWFKQGFRHCAVVAQSHTSGWVLINPSHNLQTAIVPEDIASLLHELEVCAFLRVEVKKPRKRRLVRFGLYSCVETVKQVMGIQCKGLTPYGFFKGLKASKDVVVTEI